MGQRYFEYSGLSVPFLTNHAFLTGPLYFFPNRHGICPALFTFDFRFLPLKMPFTYSDPDLYPSENPYVVLSSEGRTPQGPVDLKPDADDNLHGRRVLESSCTARQMADKKGQHITLFGYLITVKPVRTVKGDIMNFGCFIDHEGYFVDTIHFPQSLKNFGFRGTGVYRLEGKVVDEFGFLSLEVQKMAKMPRRQDPRMA